MSQEIIQMLEEMDLTQLESQIALQCAPVISGLKTSNLLIVNEKNHLMVMQIFRGTEVSCKMLHMSEDKAYFLIYRAQQLSDYLRQYEVSVMMEVLGYCETDLHNILQEFSKRYSTYMKDKSSFPHEMGLLLGYPWEDVIGFIENDGQDFLCVGYWKVYSRMERQQQLFERFDEAKASIMRMVLQGMGIVNIIHSYSMENRQVAI